MKLSYSILASTLAALILLSAPSMSEAFEGAQPPPPGVHGKIVPPPPPPPGEGPPGKRFRGPGRGGDRAVTPYGDFCPRCSNYGMRKASVGMDEAINAIRHYFREKGLIIKNIKEAGRFIKVDVFKGDKLVDRVLFDKRTGRIRSIY